MILFGLKDEGKNKMSGRVKISDLRKSAEDLGIDIRGMTKSSIVRAINKASGQGESSKHAFRIIGPLGVQGKEGSVAEVKIGRGRVMAMKRFRKNKSSAKIRKEAELQIIAAQAGLAPKVEEYNLVEKYILMEKLEDNLYDILLKKKGKLSQKVQRDLLRLFRALDLIGVFHKDPNPLNFMYDADGALRVVDFGFAEQISQTKHGFSPNMDQMTLGLVLKLREVFPGVEYPVLKQALPEGSTMLMQEVVSISEQ